MDPRCFACVVVGTGSLLIFKVGGGPGGGGGGGVGFAKLVGTSAISRS